MTIKEKILTFLRDKGVTPAVFSETTGISYSNFKGKAILSELSGDKIVKILTCYPELSADWLLMNKGDMTKDDAIENLKEQNLTHTTSVMQETSLIKRNIIKYLNSKGIKLSKFYEDAGITRGILGQNNGISEDNLSKFIEYATDINMEWLLTGKGEMLKNEISRPKESVQILHKPKIADTVLESQDILLYDIEVAANLNSLYLEQNKEMAQKIKIPNAPKCDGAMYVRGDSMYPLIKTGDIVAFKEVMNVDYIMYGEIYVVSLEVDGDEYLTVKYIYKSDKEDCIRLVSHNKEHSPHDFPISSVRYLGLVKLSIRLNTL